MSSNQRTAIVRTVSAIALGCVLAGCGAPAVAATARPAVSDVGPTYDVPGYKMPNPAADPPNATTAPPTSAPVAPPLLPGTPALPDTGDVYGVVGAVLYMDGVRVSLSNVRYDPCAGDELYAAYPGETYVLIDAELTNESYPGQPVYDLWGSWSLTYDRSNPNPSGYVGNGEGDVPLNTCHYPLPSDNVLDDDYLTTGETVNVTLLFAIPTDSVNIEVSWNGHTSLPNNRAYFAVGR